MNRLLQIWYAVMHPVVLVITFAIALGTARFCFDLGLNDPIFTTSALIFGWFIAFRSASWNQREAALLKLRADAYQRIEPSLTAAKMSLSPIEGTVRAIENFVLDIDQPNTGLFVGWNNLPLKLRTELQEYNNYFVVFLSTLESQQILFLGLLPLRRALTMEHYRVSEKLYSLLSVLGGTVAKNPQPLSVSPELANLKEEANQAASLVWDMAAYFQDFSIAIQNKALADTVGCKVPPRKPNDPKFKTLEKLPSVFPGIKVAP